MSFILPTPSMASMTSATASGTRDLQSSPQAILRRTSVPEYTDLLYSGDLATSKPASSKRRRVMGLLVYTLLNGGAMETTWATQTEYLFRSSIGTMLKLSMPSSRRELAIIMYLSPAVNGFSGSWEYWALPMPTTRWSDSSAHLRRTSMWPSWSGWNLPITRE